MKKNNFIEEKTSTDICKDFDDVQKHILIHENNSLKKKKDSTRSGI